MSLDTLHTDTYNCIFNHFDLFAHYFKIRKLNWYFFDLIQRRPEFQLLMEIYNLHTFDNTPFIENFFIRACKLNNRLYSYFMTPTLDNKFCGKISSSVAYKAINKCCRHGNFKVMEDILHNCPMNYVYYMTDIFRLCCSYNQLEMASYVLELVGYYIIDFDVNDYVIISDACFKGYLEIVKFLFEKYPAINVVSIERELENIDGSADGPFLSACKGGQLEIAKYLMSVQYGDDNINIHSRQNYAFILACMSGNLELVEWLFSMCRGYDFSEVNEVYHEYTIFGSSCESGNLELVNYLYNLRNCNDLKVIIDIHAGNNNAFFIACLSGNLELVEWLFSKCHGYDFSDINEIHVNINYDCINHLHNGYTLLSACCKSGNLELVKYVYNLRNCNDFKAIVDIHAQKEHAFLISCAYGKLDIVKWLIETCEKNGIGLIDINSTFTNDTWENINAFCDSFKYLDVTEYLLELSQNRPNEYEYGPPIYENYEMFSYCISHIYMLADEYIPVLDFLLQRCLRYKKCNITLYKHIFNVCCNYKLFYILEALMEQTIYKQSPNYKFDYKLDYKFDINVQEEFIKFNIHMNDEEIFLKYVMKDNIKVVKWLLHFSSSLPSVGPIDIHINSDSAFRLAAYYGHENILNLLINTESIFGKVDIHAQDDQALKLACYYGHTQIVQRIMYISEFSEYGMIDIHKDNEYLFRMCCEKGYVEIVIFLFEFSCENNNTIDIHANNDEAFFLSYQNGHTKISTYLLQLSDQYGKIRF